MIAIDPGARGRLAVEKLSLGAEKYGYIVVASNNAQNGALDPVLSSLNYILQDLENKFSILASRIYIAGFSGGSRMASAIASSNSFISGVIGCGAGLMPDVLPNPFSNYVYIGYVGKGDMNYTEMFDLKKLLERFSITNHLIVFDGSHDWPSDTLLVEAFEFFELNAMKNHMIALDKLSLNELYKSFYNRAVHAKTKGEMLQAFWRFQFINDQFNGLLNIDSIQYKIDHMSKIDTVQNIVHMHENILQKETKILKEIDKAILGIDLKYFKKYRTLKKRSWWQEEIAKFKLNVKEANTIEEQWMYKRILDYLWRNCSEQGVQVIGIEEPFKAMAMISIWGTIYPEQPLPDYHMARILAQISEFDSALVYLDKSVKKGFHYSDYAKKDEAFNHIKDNPKFINMIEQMVNLN